MCRKILLLAMIFPTLLVSANAQGILRKLGEKAANAGGDLIISKAKKKADKALDGDANGKKEKSKDVNEDKSEKKENPAIKANKENTAQNKQATINSKFDFVPGEKMILFDNFEQDVIGEFPLKWFTSGSGEVVKLEGQNGKWLQCNSGNFLSPVLEFPENFTAEFDLFINLSTRSSAVLPGFNFEFHDQGDKTKRLSVFDSQLQNALFIKTSFHAQKAIVSADSRENKTVKLRSDKVTLSGFQENYGGIVHIAVSVQKERLRVWFNTSKVFDLPAAVALPHQFNQMLFKGENTAEGEPGFFISNFKVAAGVPDMRSKLLEQGKFVTNGILFDVNSDRVKPESYGIIREIAIAIREGDGIKVKIIGHTDSDGAANANLELSKKRAAAVKQILVTEFGIAEDQLSTDGMGVTQPVSNNTTAAGKAENRRVEFIKL